jgi:hypothetical protein
MFKGGVVSTTSDPQPGGPVDYTWLLAFDLSDMGDVFRLQNPLTELYRMWLFGGFNFRIQP